MRPFSWMTTAHYRLLAGFWTVGIILALSIPTGNFAQVQPGFGFDKVVHVILFAGFGWLWLRALCPPEKDELLARFRRRGGLLFLGGVLFAVGTEGYQYLIPVERMPDPYDVTADLVGIVVAFASYYFYHVRRADRVST